MALLYCLAGIQSASAQRILNAIVTDHDEIPLADVKIEEENTKNVTYTRADGTFTLKYSSSSGRLIISHPAYNYVKINIDSANLTHIFLTPKVLGNPYNLSFAPGYLDFVSKNPNKRLENMPYLLGEADINRQLQMLPGVEHGSEGFSNLMVRGGNVDENLYLYNGVPVYNYNHLFGISSLFHTNGVSNVKMNRGISASNYGGRTSSVIEVETPTNSEFSGLEGELEGSPLSVGLYLRNVQKGKSYFTLSARRSWMDLLLPVEVRQNDLNAHFSDVQVNFGKNLANGDRWEANFMTSNDFYFVKLEFSPDTNSTQRGLYSIAFKWQNWLGSFKYHQRVNKRLSATHSVNFTSFSNLNTDKEEILNSTNTVSNPTTTFETRRGIREYIGQTDWTYSKSNLEDIIFGAHLNVKTYRTRFQHQIAKNYPNTTDIDEFLGERSYTPSFELSPYVEYQKRVSAQFHWSMGLRVPSYLYKTLFNTYPEPRLQANYLLDDKTAVKFGYNRHHQFTRLLTLGGTGDPQNFWVPATELTKPQSSDILEVAYERKLKKQYSLSANLYYKWLRNVHIVNNFIEVQDAENDWQNELLAGKGSSYGLELMFQKNDGYLTGWISYSFAYATRQFDELSAEPFLFDFDRRHMLKLYMSIDAGEYWDFGFNYLIGSGRLFSIPDGKFYDLEGNLQLEYSSFNNYRSPFYHRFDLSIIKKSENSFTDQTWKFYVYNAMNVKNPLWLSADFEDASLTNLSIQRTVPVFQQGLALIPGIAYVIRF